MNAVTATTLLSLAIVASVTLLLHDIIVTGSAEALAFLRLRTAQAIQPQMVVIPFANEAETEAERPGVWRDRTGS